MRLWFSVFSLVAATTAAAVADPTNVPPASDLRSATITCTAAHVYLWANNNNAPVVADDAPLLLGATVGVYVPPRTSISQRDTQFYETSIPIVEIGPYLAPTYYIPRNCVTVTGPAASPAPSPSRTPAAPHA